MMISANHIAAFARLVLDCEESVQSRSSPSAVGALLTLLHQGPMSASELARVFRVRQPTAHRLVANLSAAGLVKRQASPGRDIRYTLSATGRRRAVEVQARRLDAVNGLLGVLSTRERAALDGLVSRILAAATEDRATARYMCRFCDHGVCDGSDCPVGTAARTREDAADRPAPELMTAGRGRP